jgi:hypothetical protein
VEGLAIIGVFVVGGVLLCVGAVAVVRWVTRTSVTPEALPTPLYADPRDWALRNGVLDADELLWFYYGILDKVVSEGAIVDLDVDQVVIEARRHVAERRRAH